MQRDRQIVVIDRPELLEEHFGLGPRVDEEQRRLKVLEHLVDIGMA